MCSSIAPKQFSAGAPLGSGAASTITPPTVYASSANPSIADAGAAPAAPAAPKPPAAPGATNLGQKNPQENNPFLLALSQMGMS